MTCEAALGSGPISGGDSGAGVLAQRVPVGMCPFPSLAQAWDKHLFPVGFILPWFLSSGAPAHRLKTHVSLPACAAAVTLLACSRSRSPARACLLGFALLHFFAGSWERSPILWLFFLHAALLFPASGDAAAPCRQAVPHRGAGSCSQHRNFQNGPSMKKKNLDQLLNKLVQCIKDLTVV